MSRKFIRFDNIPREVRRDEQHNSLKDIAIIGIGLQMPLSNDVSAFWKHLEDGKDFIGAIPEPRKDKFLDYERFSTEAADYEAACLEDISSFDYPFFKLSPREANLLDPNQRLFLQVAWRTLEDAGYGGNRLKNSRTGVYVGFSDDKDYRRIISEQDPDSLSVALPGITPAIIASRISYLLNLKGPSMLIDTACSSSLVAVHEACQAIRMGECDQAIAGSVKIYLSLIDKLITQGIESSDARTRSFDAGSDGTGAGEGVAAVLLKPLHRALEDGDPVYCVIKGSAVNQDGATNGITAPSVLAQEEVLVRAWEAAGIAPETISYIEAHGTGTKLGDPIEVDAIQKALRRYKVNASSCSIGSVKSNLGHLDHAAGITGLIKAALSLHHEKLPASIHFRRPNINIDFREVYVNDRLQNWKRSHQVRRCGVSSFGLGGTNCHVVLEEAPALEKNSPVMPNYIFALSAKSQSALRNMMLQYRDYLELNTTSDIGEICYTTQLGRGQYAYRLAIVIQERSELQATLDALIVNGSWETNKHKGIFYGHVPNAVAEQDSAPKVQASSDFHDVCQSYVAGVNIAWESLYNKTYQMVNLPSYPFDKFDCWIKKRDLKNVEIVEETPMYHKVEWRVDPILQLDLSHKASMNYSVLYFNNQEDAQSNPYMMQLQGMGYRVVSVNLSSSFSKQNECSYKIRNNEEDYIRLIQELDTEHLLIVHAGTIGINRHAASIEELEQNQQRGLFSLFYLMKAIHNHVGFRHVHLTILSRHVYEVTGKETMVIPENAALFGLGKVFTQESANLTCTMVDIDDEFTFIDLWFELNNAGVNQTVAYRKRIRYTEMLSEVEENDLPSAPIAIRSEGVYVITGGIGGMGIEIAKSLASKGCVNLALIGRKSIPLPAEWDQILQDADASAELKETVNNIRGLNQNGNRTIYFSANVANQVHMQNIINELKDQFGAINGIIHCAGIAGEGFIRSKELQSFQSVIESKITGTWILNALTSNDNLQFFILCSSGTTIMGNAGEGDYTAANCYLDAWSALCNNRKGIIKVINWPAWNETGMAFRYAVNGERDPFYSVSTSEGIALFQRLLNANFTRVIVGKLNYKHSLMKASDSLPIKLSEKMQQKIVKSTHKNATVPPMDINTKNITSEYSFDFICLIIMNEWRQQLGIDEVIDYDHNFILLGGNSIIGMDIAFALSDYFQTDLSAGSIFTHDTIRKLGTHIYERLQNHSLVAATKERSLISKAKPLNVEI